MREKWARLIVLLTGLLVLLLAATFAFIQNRIESPVITESREQFSPGEPLVANGFDSIRIEVGRQVYKQQGCAGCHSIFGEGNPRNPLDGVGTRNTAEELHDWIIGADTLQTELPGYVLKLKKSYRELSGDEIDALVIYMQSLRQ